MWNVTFLIFINKNLKGKLDWHKKQFVFILLPWNNIKGETKFCHLNLMIKCCPSNSKDIILSYIIRESCCKILICWCGFLIYFQQNYSYLTWCVKVWHTDMSLRMVYVKRIKKQYIYIYFTFIYIYIYIFIYMYIYVCVCKYIDR